MKLFKITEKNGISITYQADIELDWTALGHGLSERWLPDSPMSPLSDEEKAKATNTRVVDNGLGEQITEYFFPAEYTIEIEDITAQVEAEKAQIEAIKNAQVQAGLRLQAFPAQVDACQDLAQLKLAIKQMVQDIAILLR